MWPLLDFLVNKVVQQAEFPWDHGKRHLRSHFVLSISAIFCSCSQMPKLSLLMRVFPVSCQRTLSSGMGM